MQVDTVFESLFQRKNRQGFECEGDSKREYLCLRDD